ncbi:MAG TPA: 2OG-Fe(II) oxygenase family protein [Polyangia bacterium]|nr:2OG-Fe(II) oxygenase family protein [Polyangia bacterium]
MTAPPVLRSTSLSSRDVDGALRGWGGFSIELADGELPCAEVVEAARDFFALPRQAKRAFAIEQSEGFRGWSEMNTPRDWREQLHLGRDGGAVAGAVAPDSYVRLGGPNLWPSDPGWRRIISDYMDRTAALGERILVAVAQALDVTAATFEGLARDGYLVMKLIAYHPQLPGDAGDVVTRAGVAAHVDFSWLTLTLQSGPGLEVCGGDGRWTLIEPRPRALWVHAGELLEFATSGRYRAAPHRVINHQHERTRLSIPLFINPPLDGTVPVLVRDTGAGGRTVDEREHVHRVLTRRTRPEDFHYGRAEWDRKGLGHWCATCVPARPLP